MSNNTRLIGQVKWFHKKKGFGFIQDINTKTEFFVHHSALQVSDTDTFLFLTMGEYVEYSLLPSLNNSQHKTISSDVTGIKRGLLMCEYQSQFAKNREKGEKEEEKGEKEEEAEEEGEEEVEEAEEEEM